LGIEAKDDPSKDFWTVNEPGTRHEAYNPASYMMMVVMMMMKYNFWFQKCYI